jgi:hypothetical protein
MWHRAESLRENPKSYSNLFRGHCVAAGLHATVCLPVYVQILNKCSGPSMLGISVGGAIITYQASTT